MLMLGLGLGAQGQGLYTLRTGVAPIGGYHYFMDTASGGITDFKGGYRELFASLTYDIGRALSWGTDFSAGGYCDFKGYLFRSDGGYQNSETGLVRVWGLPNFSIGLCASWKALSLGKADLVTWWGLEYAHYFQTETSSSPGFGASIRASLDIPLAENLAVSLGGLLNASSHAESSDADDPSTSYYPFKMLEFGPLLGLAWGF
jgi:hypothetical protein